MRFMLLQNYGEVGSGYTPMSEWTPGGSRLTSSSGAD